MRVSRLVLSCSVVALLVAPMASPAGAAEDCVSPYIAAVSNPPAAPALSEIVQISPSISVNGNLVAAYAVAVATHFSNATATFAECETGNVSGLSGCIQGTPGVAPWIYTSDPTLDRWVKVTGLDVDVHYQTMLSDARAIVACAGAR